ncbi:uncharacterized protein LOC104425188 isoform X1 [Eucalyptus grandis]|uniref:uncharacterized protein LOC104425188 isoform X1 n=1 Tax=Eucalyptus grandis TaxID=71139 RepID=UPI0005272DCC|nr:uncharacterized protein LOC104425188 isoform X1 [Eucalyptus grandis]
MFTEGLDEGAISWVKQGSDVGEAPARSPLTEKLPGVDPFPKSPLGFSGNSYMSTHSLPPLKFHSGLLTPHSIVAPPLGKGSDDDDDWGSDEESVASVPEDMDCSYTDEEDDSSKPVLRRYDEEQVFGHMPPTRAKSGTGRPLNRGSAMEDLQIEVPGTCRRHTSDGGLGMRTCAPSGLTSAPVSSHLLRERVLRRNRNPTHVNVVESGVSDLGTPSAPPIMDDGTEEKSFRAESEHEEAFRGLVDIDKTGNGPRFSENSEVIEDTADWGTSEIPQEVGERVRDTIQDEKEVQIPHQQTNSLEHSPHYSASGQYAWQTLVAYDACIRLCLYAWARGCTEAPEFLRDECLVLRNAFGLQKFLLHPRGVKLGEGRSTKNVQSCPLKGKKIVGKIRVEVRRLRIVPRRKLKSTYSQRSAMYLQAGAEYVRHVSSLVKTGMNSLKLASFTVTPEEPLSCLFQLKSSSDDPQAETDSGICLHPGCGDYHVFFPESQGDALLVEVQDTKKSVLGRAAIPISSLTDNPSDKLRWWPIYHDDHECVGKIQLSMAITSTSDETHHIKSGPVVETLAYDLVLDAAMRAQHFHSGNLRIDGPWKWLLAEFANYYEVSDSYTKLRYLSQVMNVATPTKGCLELVNELLVPITKTKGEKNLTRQEKGILLDCETQIEGLLASVFENYKSLDENSTTGLVDLLGPMQDSAAPALAPAVQVFTLLHDILAQDAQNMLRNYLQTAAKKRCRKHMLETDEFVSSNSDTFLVDQVTISTAYLKMKNLCINLSKEIQADIKIHNQHVLPSSVDLSNITAAVYSTELYRRISAFLAAWPPSSPLPYVNELLKAAADFERDLESWNLSPAQDGLDSRNLFHCYIVVWVQDMQLNLLELCKAETVPWSGVITNHFTSPFPEEMYEKMKNALTEYEVVINHWPQYSLILENAVADVERAIIKALEKQYNDILTLLKDSIPKRLNMQVQKLTRRQSTAVYSVPSQLGIFLNTIKRILDVLHCRVEDMLKCWASYLPVTGDKKSLFGEQMNGITVLLRTKYKNYLQATVGKLVSNMQENRSTRLKRILEETKEEDGEVEIRERMQMLSLQLIDSITNLHEVFSSQIFVATCRGLWDRMGQIVLKFLEGRKENRVWYNGSYYALVILDDTFASQMQRLLGNALQEKDLEPPRSVTEARSILCRDTANAADSSSYFYV